MLFRSLNIEGIESPIKAEDVIKVDPDGIVTAFVQVFGATLFSKFIDVFGGRVIKVPNKWRLYLKIRARDIYDTIKKDNSLASYKLLCDKYSTNIDNINRIYRTVEKNPLEYNIERSK